MTIKIPSGAEEIINRINEAGYEAYVVGGCVRDSLLGREPNDWDITTSANPYEVKALSDVQLIRGLNMEPLLYLWVMISMKSLRIVLMEIIATDAIQTM